MKIEISKISKRFGDNQVLKELDLEVAEGESLIIIGASGCGKTVLLKHIVGLIKPDSGKIFIDGEEITGKDEGELKPISRKFGVVFQSSALFDSLTVGENVSLGLRETKMYKDDEAKRIAKEKLELVNLSGTWDLLPFELSGGMKKRVALARALAMDPEIMIYDEPTSELDPAMARNINTVILDLKKRLKVTSVTVTHDINHAYLIGDRIGVLHEGRIIELGTPSQIRGSTNPLVRQFTVRGEWKKGGEL